MPDTNSNKKYGWTFAKGSKDERVDESTTIYSSTSCLSVVKTGVDIDQRISDENFGDMSAEEVAEERAKLEQQAEEERKKIEEEYEIYLINIENTRKIIATRTDNYRAVLKEWNAYVKKYNHADDAQKVLMKPQLVELEKKRDDAYKLVEDGISALEQYEEENKGIKDTEVVYQVQHLKKKEKYLQ